MVKNLHFVWHQGFTHLPRPLVGVRGMWKRLNPDYEIFSWNGFSLAHFVAEFYPQFYEQYRSLGAGLPPNVRVIKQCDLARLLLLHHHGGWYLDTDCMPTRPLSSLLNMGTVRHRDTPFDYSRDYSHPTILGEDPAPIQVDFNSYQMVMSREHLPNPALGGYPVSNTVIYAKAGSPVLMEMIEGCVERAGEKVLEFAGPLGLGRWLRERADAVKGKLLLLPPYYFLWQKHDMGPPWEHTVCCHLNRLDWTDKTKDQPWDI